MYTAYLGLGSNLGERRELLQHAVDRIARFATVAAAASVYETEPVGFVSEHRFLNTAVKITTTDDPSRLMKRLTRVERAMGRAAHTHCKDRLIDLDILMYEGLYFVAGRVEVPHSALERRRFALQPLSEIAPGVLHPLTGISVSTLLKRCTDRSSVAATSFRLLLPS